MLMMEVKTQDSFVKDEKNVSTDLISTLHFFGGQYMGKLLFFHLQQWRAILPTQC